MTSDETMECVGGTKDCNGETTNYNCEMTGCGGETRDCNGDMRDCDSGETMSNDRHCEVILVLLVTSRTGVAV